MSEISPPLRLSPTYLALLEQHKDQRDGSRQSREAMTFLRHKVEQAAGSSMPFISVRRLCARR